MAVKYFRRPVGIQAVEKYPLKKPASTQQRDIKRDNQLSSRIYKLVLKHKRESC